MGGNVFYTRHIFKNVGHYWTKLFTNLITKVKQEKLELKKNHKTG